MEPMGAPSPLDRQNITESAQAQISFDRPEQSPCLDKIRNDKNKMNKAIALLKQGKKRLKETPRGDIEKEVVPCEEHQNQLRKYAARLEEGCKINRCIANGEKYYDPQ